MNANTKLVGVQYLRAVAAIFVVIEHAEKLMMSPEYFGRGAQPVYLQGHLGVFLFFVISGFIITIVSLNPDLSPRLGLREFTERRFARIVPFLWFCVITYAALRLLGTGKFELMPYLRALVIWPVGEIRPNVVWTLRHEMMFYLLFGISMLLPRRQLWILVGWLALPVVVHGLEIEGSDPWLAFVSNPIHLYFGTGMLLGWLHLRGLLRHSVPGGFGLVIAACAALALAGAWQPEHSTPRSTIVFVVCGLLVWLGIGIRDKQGWGSRLGLFLGDASYAVYLVHNIVLLALLKPAAKLGANPMLSHAMLVVLAVAAGAAVHLTVERPLVRRVSRWFERRASGAPPGTQPPSARSAA